MRLIQFVVISILVPLSLFSQELPSLPVDDQVSMGSLPNGLDYYIVRNPESPGKADFALVQKSFDDKVSSRTSLAVLPNFGNRRPYSFFASNGVSCSEQGYVTYGEDATRFDFREVPVYEKSVADTALMMLFNMAAPCIGNQAIIVAGDVSSSEFIEKMKLFSLLLDSREDASSAEAYHWSPTDSLKAEMSVNGTVDLAAVHVMCRSMRPPREVLNTPVPLVTHILSKELAMVLEARIRRSFRSADIPLADVKFRCSDASREGDEMYMVSVFTSASFIEKAARAVASEIADLDRTGALLEEFRGAKSRLAADAARDVLKTGMTNREYVDKCVSAYLYGTNLAPLSTLPEFILGRNIPDDRDLVLFNGYVQALLDVQENMYVRIDLPDNRMDDADVKRLFEEGWAQRNSVHPVPVKPLDAILPQPRGKVKLHSESTEPITGGKLLTFSNGIKVVYRNMPGRGRFNFGFLIKGGFPQVPGLREGESEYVGDMLMLNTFSGMPGSVLREKLSERGISFRTGVSLSDLRITGDAPTAEFATVMRTMLSLTSGRKPDAESFGRFCKEVYLRREMSMLEPRDVDIFLENRLFPDYPYNRKSYPVELERSFQSRAEQYFASQFSKMVDGVFVFIGDIPEEVLKKELCRFLGDFSVQKKYASRPMVDKTPVSGVRIYTDQAGSGVVGEKEKGAYMAFCVPMVFTMSNYAAWKIALNVLGDEVAAALKDSGAYYEIQGKLDVYPKEQTTVFLSAGPAAADGLPMGVAPASVDEIRNVLRSVISKAGSLPIPASKLRQYKAALLDRFESSVKNSDYLMDAVLMRYSEGKNMLTDYKMSINAIDESAVRSMLTSLEDASSVEYIIK